MVKEQPQFTEEELALLQRIKRAGEELKDYSGDLSELEEKLLKELKTYEILKEYSRGAAMDSLKKAAETAYQIRYSIVKEKLQESVGKWNSFYRKIESNLEEIADENAQVDILSSISREGERIQNILFELADPYSESDSLAGAVVDAAGEGSLDRYLEVLEKNKESLKGVADFLEGNCENYVPGFFIKNAFKVAKYGLLEDYIRVVEKIGKAVSEKPLNDKYPIPNFLEATYFVLEDKGTLEKLINITEELNDPLLVWWFAEGLLRSNGGEKKYVEVIGKYVEEIKNIREEYRKKIEGAGESQEKGYLKREMNSAFSGMLPSAWEGEKTLGMYIQLLNKYIESGKDIKKLENDVYNNFNSQSLEAYLSESLEGKSHHR